MPIKLIKYYLPSILTIQSLLVSVATAKKPSWDITFIIDQSGSMLSADRAQYVLLIPSVIADLSTSSDRVSVIKQDGCPSGPPCTSVQLQGNRARFKNELESLPRDSSFTTPLKTALLRHQSSSQYDHSLISLVYDDAGQNLQEINEIKQMIKTSHQDGFVYVMSK